MQGSSSFAPYALIVYVPLAEQYYSLAPDRKLVSSNHVVETFIPLLTRRIVIGAP
jgi:hypothetical protein